MIGNESKCWDRELFAIGRPACGTGVLGSRVKKRGGERSEGDFLSMGRDNENNTEKNRQSKLLRIAMQSRQIKLTSGRQLHNHHKYETRKKQSSAKTAK